ncbi:cullin-4A [Trichonephila clavipes]|nr:cullin-4A [Trichonephila clavipes]
MLAEWSLRITEWSDKSCGALVFHRVRKLKAFLKATRSCRLENSKEGQSQPSQSEELGSNPGEGMDVCKCTVPLRHGGALNSRRAASPLVCLGEERWEVPDHLQGFLPPNWSGTEQKRTVTRMVLKAKANDRRKF